MPGGTSGGTATDFVVVVSRSEGRWSASALPSRVGDDLDALVAVLRQEPSDVTLGFVSVAEEILVAARIGVHGGTRLLLSDVTAATEWDIAEQVLEQLDLPEPEDDDESQPVGDLGMFADFGVDAREVTLLLDDLDLSPEAMLADIAGRLGFREDLARAVSAAME